MIQPELKVTGYRGVWSESLNEDISISFAIAFALFTKSDSGKENPTILIGRDGRESGQTIANAIIPEIEKLGVNVIYGDVLPTPTIMLSVKEKGYDGAIIITASHNPIKYNGLKFVTKGARMTNESEVEKIKSFLTSERENVVLKSSSENIVLGGLVGATANNTEEIFHQKNLRASQNNISEELIKIHVDKILANIDVEKIRARKFKVAVDMINASACVIDPYLFEKLGVEYVALNDTPNGKFAHEPEPIEQNLKDICALMKENKCDVGFAHDPDADRLVIIDEYGDYISEEYTLGFGIENVMPKNPNRNVVVNMSTSQMSADITEKYGGTCYRTKVGEANVFAGIDEHDAIIGGEGGSGCIYPTINNCRDGFVSMTLALELLATRNCTVNEMVNILPKYFMKKDKWSVEGKNTLELYEKLKNHFSNGKFNTLDGLRIDFEDQSWIHLRPSNTEPIIRLMGEAKNPKRVEELFIEAEKVIS